MSGGAAATPTGIRVPLTAEQRARFEAAESTPVDLSVDAVLERARRRVGLDDFGPMDFTERLHALLEEVANDDNLWQATRIDFSERCTHFAAMRLCVQHHVTTHPSVADQTIDRPIIITGLPRSGTTHLENLIGADRRLRHLPVYLGAEPAPIPGEPLAPDGVDPRWTRADARWQALKANAVMGAMHEHSPDHACGENELQMPDFASYQWEWIGHLPGWRDRYFAEDQTPHFAYGRTVLQSIMVQLADRDPSSSLTGRRWMLKGNSHSEQLPALLATYPDATTVMIHRDPVAILQSLLTMRGLPLTWQQKQPRWDELVAYWIDRVERMLREYIRTRDVVPAGQRIDVLFGDVMANDVGSASDVLERSGLPVNDECLADLQRYMDEHPRGKHGKVAYDLAGDFGVTAGELYERFAFYFDEYPITREVRT